MKKFLRSILTIMILSIVPAASAIAQNEIYEKYSSKEGVTKVYISSTMLSFLGDNKNDRSVTINSEEYLDITSISKNLSGLYILSSERPSIINDMRGDLHKMLKSNKYELMMDVTDDDENVKMYVRRKSNNIDAMIMEINDKKELTIISLEGTFTDDTIKSVLNFSKKKK